MPTEIVKEIRDREWRFAEMENRRPYAPTIYDRKDRYEAVVKETYSHKLAVGITYVLIDAYCNPDFDW